VAAVGALAVAVVNRDPAPDEPMPVTEQEAERLGERIHR
jgi:hypothetical protein